MPVANVYVRRGPLVFSVRDHQPTTECRGVVLALHGWPQDGRSWDAVAERLVAAGYRVCAPNLRGASTGAAPRSRWSYRSSELVADVEALIEWIGEPVHLVGHDWGSGLAWQVAGVRPDLVRTLTAVSVPHPGAFVKTMLTSTQLPRWWFSIAFQVPILPELVLGNRDAFQRGLEKAGLPAEAARRDAERLTDRRVRRGGLNWYRAIPFTTRGLGFPTVEAPVLQVWGDRDPVILRRGCEGSERYCSGDFELVALEGVAHFVPEEAPDRLSELIVSHAGSVA